MNTRERFAQMAIARGLEVADAEEKLHELYDLYNLNGSSDAEQDIMVLAEKIGRGTAISILRSSSHFKWQDLEDYLQIISLKLVEKLRRDRESGTRQPNIVHLIRSLYHLRACDIRDSLAVHLNGPSTLSLDDLNETEGGKTLEIVGEEVPMVDDLEFEWEKRSLHQNLIRLYLAHSMYYYEEPQRPVAHLYSRFLYQLEMRYNPDEMDLAAQTLFRRDTHKDSEEDKWVRAFSSVQEPATLSSVKWATRRMSGENMLDLCKKAQKSLHTYFADNLPWGRKYAATLNTPFRPGLLWKDMVYTEHFTEKQTAYWSERMHIYATDSTVAYVKAHKELFRDVTNFDSPIKSIILAMQKEGNYDTSNQR